MQVVKLCGECGVVETLGIFFHVDFPLVEIPSWPLVGTFPLPKATTWAKSGQFYGLVHFGLPTFPKKMAFLVHMINPLPVFVGKLVTAGYWPLSFLDVCSFNLKNLAIMKSSWPHTWWTDPYSMWIMVSVSYYQCSSRNSCQVVWNDSDRTPNVCIELICCTCQINITVRYYTVKLL